MASYFTDAYASKMAGNDDKLLVSTRVFCHLMKSWTGLIYLSTSSNSTLLFIVDSLKMPLQGYRVGFFVK